MRNALVLCLCLTATACVHEERQAIDDEGLVCVFALESEAYEAFEAGRVPSFGDWGYYLAAVSDGRPGYREDQSYRAGEALFVAWQSGSINTGCVVEQGDGIEATLEGGRLEIDTWSSRTFRYDTFDGPSCNAGAEAVFDGVVTDPLPSGRLELVFGEASFELEVPSEGKPVCLHSPIPPASR